MTAKIGVVWWEVLRTECTHKYCLSPIKYLLTDVEFLNAAETMSNITRTQNQKAFLEHVRVFVDKQQTNRQHKQALVQELNRYACVTNNKHLLRVKCKCTIC